MVETRRWFRVFTMETTESEAVPGERDAGISPISDYEGVERDSGVGGYSKANYVPVCLDMVRFLTADRDGSTAFYSMNLFPLPNSLLPCICCYVRTQKTSGTRGLRAQGSGLRGKRPGGLARATGGGRLGVLVSSHVPRRAYLGLLGLTGHATYFRYGPKMDTRNCCFSQPRRACRHEPSRLQIGVYKIPLRISPFTHEKATITKRVL